MGIDLRQLALLREAIALGSISKAAARLRIAQPHVSRLIRGLEAEIGAPLLERHAGGVRATPAGEVLAALAVHVDGEIAAARARIAESAAQVAGTVILGVPGSLALPLLPGLIAAVREAHPAVRLRLVDGFSARLHDMTLAGQLDLALLYADRASVALVDEPLLAEPLGLVGQGSGAGEPVAVAALVGRPLVLPAPPNRLRLLIDAAAAAAGVTLTVAEELDSYPVLIRMAVSGAAETILPYSAVAADVAQHALHWRALDPLVERRIVLARARDRLETTAMHAVAQVVRDRIAVEAAANRWSPAGSRSL